MSTSSVALDPNDPRLTRPIAPHIPSPPSGRFAKRYLTLTGDEDRAERLDQCGRYRFKQDVNSHTKHEYQHCMDRYCHHCAIEIRKALIGRWEETVGSYELPVSHFTFIEALIPHSERSLESAQAEFEELKRRLNDAAQRVGLGTAQPYWIYSPGYKEKSFVLRILYLGKEFCEFAWRDMFSTSATVCVMKHSAHQLSWAFERRLLAPSLPKDPNDRAEQSAMFSSVRLFRSEGLEITPGWREPDPGDLFADENSPANISEEMRLELENTLLPLPDEPGKRDICSICGEKFTQESQWFLLSDPKPTPADLVWFPRGPSS